MLLETYNVQLEHVNEERSRMEHGFVTILDADGNTLAHSDDFQHNRKYHNRFEMADELLEAVNDKMKGKATSAVRPAADVATTTTPEGAAAA